VFFWYVILIWSLISCTRKASRREASVLNQKFVAF
jgi:hypothetical protein